MDNRSQNDRIEQFLPYPPQPCPTHALCVGRYPRLFDLLGSDTSVSLPCAFFCRLLSFSALSWKPVKCRYLSALYFSLKIRLSFPANNIQEAIKQVALQIVLRNKRNAHLVADLVNSCARAHQPCRNKDLYKSTSRRLFCGRYQKIVSISASGHVLKLQLQVPLET